MAKRKQQLAKAPPSEEQRQRQTLETWKAIAPEHFALAYMQSQLAAINRQVLRGHKGVA